MNGKGTMGAKGDSAAFLLFIMVTSLFCGALVMVIEVLGSRVIGPFFGASLFVWTSLIAVTLVALSAGYAVGGIFSDRRETPDYLYGIILLSGFFVLLIPLLKGTVLKACVPMGLRVGALASSTILFGPSLFLLGCVSPYIIKIAAREMKNIGRTVGLFYALSTVGSFIGTVFTGFVLIAYFQVNQIFLTVGTVLIALSVIYFLTFRKNYYFTALLVIPLLWPSGEGPVSKVMSNGTTVTKVFSKENFYGKLTVLDYSYREKHTRELVIDGLIQGGIDMANGLSVYAYPYYSQFLPYSMNPAGKECLVVGLGAGVIPMWYEKMGVRTDVVDINPDIVEIARKYFGFSVSGDVIVEDARYHLNTTGKRYDYVILDVFNGDTTPGHVLSREALQLINGHLTGTGILAINLIGSIKQETFMTASVIKTLRDIFATVELYPNFEPEEREGVGNLTVIACNHALPPISPELFRKFPVHPLAAAVREFRGKTFQFPRETPAIVLTDDYNPIDFYDVWLKERIRQGILKNTEWDMII
ncbi:MAG: hypothetical protein FD174_2545 [Geobacteraceae bacterium]|nr:MAG: hypothetical protein FD174_2545 [Geobacteraceae bacterium]